MYHSPFREDHDASMKVDYRQNLWIDYGIGEGGTIIDLVMRINSIPLNEAIARLDKYDKTVVQNFDAFSFHRNNDTGMLEKQEPIMKIMAVKELTHPALLNYLHKRCIDTATAMQYCSELHYTVNDKPYYAIAFPNDTGGYDLRNEYFQGCFPPKDITQIKQKEQMSSCYVFEGFMDYLSFLILRNKHNPDIPGTNNQNYIILNSTSNVAKALDRLEGYENIHCFLDNDLGGQQAFLKIRQKFEFHVQDASKHYAGYKDLNDYLCGRQSKPLKSISQESPKRQLFQPPKKRKRGIGM
jgi:hypothetical protein